MKSEIPGAPPAALLRALRQVLRPLVRLLLAHQVTYPCLAAFLKGLFVEVGEQEAAVDGQPPTDSRIHVLTGVHRKDVRRLRRAPPAAAAPPASVSVGGQIVARWAGLARYRGAGDQPAPLPLAGTGGGPSFEELVNDVSRQDVRPAAVLEELVRLGICRLDARQRVCLVRAAFVPDKGFDEKAFYFGQNTGDHLAAAAHNLAGGDPPLFDRSVYYGRLTPASVARLERRAQTLAMRALQAINRLALELQTRDRGQPGARARINFGAYVYRGASAPAGEERRHA